MSFNREEIHGFKIISKGAMTYIEASAVGFILAIITCDSMDLEILTVKGEEKIVLQLYLNSR